MSDEVLLAGLRRVIVEKDGNVVQRAIASAEIAICTRDEQIKDAIRIIQMHQPGGSPPPGDWLVLLGWVLCEKGKVADEKNEQLQQQAKRITELEAELKQVITAPVVPPQPADPESDDDKEQICESCGQIHPANVGCPPHEVRVTGVACFRMQINWLKRENLRLRGDVHCAEKVAEVVSNNRNVVETLNDELEQRCKQLEAYLRDTVRPYKYFNGDTWAWPFVEAVDELLAVLPAQPQPADSTPITLKRVETYICSACLAGTGKECHTPGCVLCMHNSPGFPIMPELYTVKEEWPVEDSPMSEQPFKDEDVVWRWMRPDGTKRVLCKDRYGIYKMYFKENRVWDRCDHTILDVAELLRQLAAAQQERDELKERAEKLEAAWSNMRDSIRCVRHPEQINAILAVIDDAYPPTFAPQPPAQKLPGFSDIIGLYADKDEQPPAAPGKEG